jgi:hypothetical protein
VNRVCSLLLALDELDRDGEGQSGEYPETSALIGQSDQGDRVCVVSESDPVFRQ